ncbi:hypothetical protein [Desulfovibrio desulfuricans]|uniref:hypothetical protein n=1 Tax=Desulfovibrio desulfuricans TaxID=876 RepID=UPI001AE20E5D|nr:hypothetical protein [Desulfovibrio desulfuricans]QTO40855.1 hypothetical protein J8J02_02740 [Desulfovibrio desulfuricans]
MSKHNKANDSANTEEKTSQPLNLTIPADEHSSLVPQGALVPDIVKDQVPTQVTTGIDITEITKSQKPKITDERLLDVVRDSMPGSFRKIDIFSALPKTTKDAERYMKDASAVLEKINDHTLLKRSICMSLPLLNGMIDFTTALKFPYQICYGLMLNRLKQLITDKNLGNFTEQIKQILPGMNIRTAQNYMLAAKIVELDGMEKYYPAGITLIYKFMRLIGNGVLEKDADPIMYAFRSFGSPEDVDEYDYVRVAEYVLFLYAELSELNIDRELYNQLFQSGFEIRNKDITTIKKYEKIYPGFANKYIKALPQNDNNRDRAVSFVTGAPPVRKGQSWQKEKQLESAENLLAKLAQLFDADSTIALSHSEEILAHKVIKQLGRKTNASRILILAEISDDIRSLNNAKGKLHGKELELANALLSELNTLLKS